MLGRVLLSGGLGAGWGWRGLEGGLGGRKEGKRWGGQEGGWKREKGARRRKKGVDFRRRGYGRRRFRQFKGRIVPLLGRDDGADFFGEVSEAINVLAGADPYRPAGQRLGIAGLVERADVALAVLGGRQEAQEDEVLDAAHPGADRGGAIHQRVLGGLTRNVELEADAAVVVGGRQFSNGVGAEKAGHGRGQVEEAQALGCSGGVYLDEVVVAVEGRAAHAVAGVVAGGGQGPGGALFGRQQTPAAGDGPERDSVILLELRSRIPPYLWALATCP